jgi:hypothetical protein
MDVQGIKVITPFSPLYSTDVLKGVGYNAIWSVKLPDVLGDHIASIFKV